RALCDYQAKENSVRDISHLLSAKPAEVAEAVKRLQGENQQWKEKLTRMQNHYLEKKLEEISQDTEQYILFEQEMDKNAARRFVDAGMRRCGKLCGIFLGTDENGYQYTFGSQTLELKVFLKDFHEKFSGKGGGKGEMVQGTVSGSEAELRAYLMEILH
ncbi:MAG: DHHA1 domain-containing protein, partial [Elusimicrobiales bacterium]|nr:DHHA1 domain-containing protein [Elusimicrobiales bacterium]